MLAYELHEKLKPMRARLAAVVRAQRQVYFSIGVPGMQYEDIIKSDEDLENLIAAVVKDGVLIGEHEKLMVGDVSQHLRMLSRKSQKAWIALIEQELVPLNARGNNGQEVLTKFDARLLAVNALASRVQDFFAAMSVDGCFYEEKVDEELRARLSSKEIKSLFIHRAAIIEAMSNVSNFSYFASNEVLCMKDKAVQRFLNMYEGKAYAKSAAVFLETLGMIGDGQAQILYEQKYPPASAADARVYVPVIIPETEGLPTEGLPEARITLPAALLERAMAANDKVGEAGADFDRMGRPHKRVPPAMDSVSANAGLDRTGWERFQFPAGTSR